MPATRPILLAVALLSLTGCSTSPPTPRPQLGIAIDYEPTSAIFATGSTPTETAGTTAPVTDDARTLHVTVRDCVSRPSQPLDTVLDAVLATRGQPFRAGSPGLRGLAVATGDAQPETTSLDPSDAKATGQVTASGTLGSTFVTKIQVDGSGWPTVLAQRTPSGIRLVIHRDANQGSNQTAMLARLRPFELAPGEPLTLLQREPGGGRHVALELQLGDSATADAVTAVQAKLASRSATTTDSPAPRVTELARQAIGARPRRGALLAVAAQFNLDRCLDLVLCLEEAELIAISNALPANPNSDWQVEQAILAAILSRLQRGELPPPVVLCLRRHLGALALDPTGLEFALAASTSTAELSAAVIANNRRALSARRASQRALAHEWLGKRDLAVPEYDPMAPRAARKAALASADRRAR